MARLLGSPTRGVRPDGRKLRVEADSGYRDDQVAVIADFVNYSCESLGIEGGFEIHLVGDRKSNGITTTAFCDPDRGIMKIYCKGRAVPDVLRSIGHELAHLRQGEKGEIGPNPIQYAGGYLEDDANAKAGTMLKMFAKQYGMDRVYES